MATLDGDFTSGVVDVFFDSPKIHMASGDFEARGFFDGTKIHDRSGDLLSLCAGGGSVTPTGSAVFTITKLSDTPYRLVYNVSAVVTGGGASAGSLIPNATLVADCYQGECPLRTKLLDKVYGSAPLAYAALVSLDGQSNICGDAGAAGNWTALIGINGSGKPTVTPQIYTLEDGTFTATLELIFRHSFIV